MPQPEKTPSVNLYSVIVSMKVSDEEGKEVDSKTVDFGKLQADQLKGLTDIFAMMASNVEYIRNLAPQYEKVGNTIPPYLR